MSSLWIYFPLLLFSFFLEGCHVLDIYPLVLSVRICQLITLCMSENVLLCLDSYKIIWLDVKHRLTFIFFQQFCEYSSTDTVDEKKAVVYLLISCRSSFLSEVSVIFFFMFCNVSTCSYFYLPCLLSSVFPIWTLMFVFTSRKISTIISSDIAYLFFSTLFSVTVIRCILEPPLKAILYVLSVKSFVYQLITFSCKRGLKRQRKSRSGQQLHTTTRDPGTFCFPEGHIQQMPAVPSHHITLPPPMLRDCVPLKEGKVGQRVKPSTSVPF